MSKNVFTILFLLFGMCATTFAQSTFERRISKGKELYNSGDYVQAKKYFESAKTSPDKYANWESICTGWIRKCDAALKAVPQKPAPEPARVAAPKPTWKFVYYENGDSLYASNLFMKESEAMEMAKTYFDSHKKDSLLCAVSWFDKTDFVGGVNNRDDVNSYTERRKREKKLLDESTAHLEIAKTCLEQRQYIRAKEELKAVAHPSLKNQKEELIKKIEDERNLFIIKAAASDGEGVGLIDCYRMVEEAIGHTEQDSEYLGILENKRKALERKMKSYIEEVSQLKNRVYDEYETKQEKNQKRIEACAVWDFVVREESIRLEAWFKDKDERKDFEKIVIQIKNKKKE